MTKGIKVHASIQARAGVTIGNDTGVLPANPSPNTMWASGKDLLLSCVINGVQTWFPLVRGSDFSAYMHTQANANDTWTVNHGLNSDGLWVQVLDSNGNIVQTLSDYVPSPTDPLNSFTLKFALPIGGHAFVVGNKVISAALVNATEFNIADSIQLSSAGFTIDGTLVDKSILKNLPALVQSITAETTRAQAAETGIANNLNSEITRAQAAEGANATAIGAETARATGAEAALQTAINAEATRAQAVEGSLAALSTSSKASLVAAINEAVTTSGIKSLTVTYTAAPSGSYGLGKFVVGANIDGRPVMSGDTVHMRTTGDIYTVQDSGAPVLTNPHSNGVRVIQSQYSVSNYISGPNMGLAGTYLFAKDASGNLLAAIPLGYSGAAGISYRNTVNNEYTNVYTKLGGIGALASLTTSATSDLVSAINEVVANLNSKTSQASILSTLGLTSISGVNTGDETLASIKTKLGITTLSGSNTGDETQSSILSKLSLTAISGVNTGDQTITLSGDVLGSGTGAFAATIAPNSVTLSKMATIPTATLLGRNSAGTGNPEVLSPVTILSMLGLSNVNNTSDANKPVSTAQAAADAATLSSAKSYADGLVVGLWDDRGNYDASGNVFPSTGGSGAGGAVLKGDIWTVSVAGTVGGTSVVARQTIRAMVDAPGQTAANWAIGLANTDIEDQIVGGVTGKAPSQNAVSVALANEVTARNAAIAATSTGVNTGDETAATIKSKLGISTLSGSNTGDETNATILSKLGITSISGVNTGDETAATIKSKLGITTLSGSNTGDETQASLLSKLGNTVVTPSTFNGLTPYDISTFGIGKPAVSDTMLAMVMTRSMTLPAGLTGSVAKCTTAPTAAISFNILKNGASIGSINFAANATSGTFTMASATSLASGDILTIVAPATQDATFAGLLATLVATLN